MKRLVVGVDRSDQSRSALRWAASIASAMALDLLVVEARSGGDRSELAEAVGRMLGEPAANVETDFEVLDGSAAGAILGRLAPDDGLVLGTRGRGGFAGLLLGSVSRECTEHAPCPVMLVRDESAAPHDKAPILVGHDGSPSSRRALEWALELAEPTGAEVIAVHVWQTSASEVRPTTQRRLAGAAEQSITGWAGEVSPSVRPMEVEGEPRMELVDLAHRLNAGLLVVGRRGSGAVRALRIGSVASYLITTSPVPVAVVPPSPDAPPS
jgi:nucleotide-binding universal stress UspA family protein